MRITARKARVPTFVSAMFGWTHADLVATSYAEPSNRGGGQWPCVLFADRAITLTGSAIVQGYDSQTGETTVPSVCSNTAEIALQGHYRLFGDAHPAPGGVVTVGGSAMLTGGSDPLVERVTLPRVAMPGSGRTFDATVNGNRTVSLTRGTYRMPSGFTVNGNAVLDVANGPVEIFASGTVTLNGRGVTNPGRSPRNLVIHMVGPGSLTVNGTQDFYGIIDAPDADVKLNGTARFYGAVVAKTVQHNGNNDVYLDTSLADDLGVEVSDGLGDGHAHLVR